MNCALHFAVRVLSAAYRYALIVETLLSILHLGQESDYIHMPVQARADDNK
jgi:hypothetical protein